MGNRVRTARRGFTLVEALATIAVIGALGTATTGLIARAAASFSEQAVGAQMVTELSAGLERIDRMVREIPLEAQAGIVPAVDSMTATSLVWTTGAGQWTLTLSGSSLLLTEPGQAAQVLLEDVSAVTLRAFDESNAALAVSLSGTACDAIRRVSVSITMTRQGRSETLRAKVFLREAMRGGAGL
jgi:prepilin-type N-terminal cleavage/methylation domain-containing protein